MPTELHGAGGAPGIALGRAFCYLPAQIDSQYSTYTDPAVALEHFSTAQAAAAAALNALAERLRQEAKADQAAIFEAQALLVEDAYLSDEVSRRLQEEHMSLIDAITATTAQMRADLEALDDAYLRERAADMDAIGSAILNALTGNSAGLGDIPAGAILVAANLTPAETAGLRSGSVAGFATAYGGPTGHTAILARALGIPAVVGLGEAALSISDGSALILDGDAALLITEPDTSQSAVYMARLKEQHDATQRRSALRELPGQLSDGHAVALWANIGHPDEVQHALENGAEGIGLFRSEFLFLDRRAPPDEREQYLAYRRTLEAMAGRPVVIRTLDIGGDKPLPYLDMPQEENPFLGTRGLRLCMRHSDLFHTQLRALLRAAVHGDLWIMLPMIATLDDLRWGRAQLQNAAQALRNESIVHRDGVRLGIMIETPAAAITADLLAAEADFFSVGSNDLTQYTMAVDRGLAELAAHYPHDAPAVLRLIAHAARAAHSANIPIGVCGELAALTSAAAILAGMGMAELSMAPRMIPIIKEHLHSISLPQAQGLARAACVERG